MSDADELWEGGVLGESREEGGELRTDEEVGAGCNTLYAALCAQVRGSEATVEW